MTDVLDYLAWLFADYPTTFDIAWLAGWIVAGVLIGVTLNHRSQKEV